MDSRDLSDGVSRPSRGIFQSMRQCLQSLWQLGLLGGLLLVLIWSGVQWESARLRQERLANFRQNLMHLSEILGETLVRHLDGLDNALLILRNDYLENKDGLRRTVGLLRHGPLKGLDLYVTVIGRDGYTKMSDAPGGAQPVYLGDRQYFRFFAEGGADQLYISEPVLGRISKRWGMQLARPILDDRGKFLGVIAIFLPPEELTRFVQPLAISADTILSVASYDGALLSRSKDLEPYLGSRLSPELLEEYRRNLRGFALRRSMLDQVERGLAHRWLSGYSLLLVVARTPTAVYAEIGAARKLLLLLGGGASLLVLASLALIGRSMRQRQRIEARLNREHAHLVQAQRIAHLGSWELDLPSNQLYWSDEVYRIFEIDRHRAPASYQAFLDTVHPDDREAVDRAYAESLQKHAPYDIVHRLQMSDGRIKWVQEQCTTDFDAQGRPHRSSGTVLDITERKREEAAREALSRERLLLLESTGEGIYGIGADGHCNFVNQAGARMLAYEAAELIGKNLHELTHHSHADGSPYPLADCPVYRAFVSGQPTHSVEEVFWRKDGMPVPVEYSAYPVRDADRITGTVVVFSDITERRRTQAEMRIAATAFETQEGMFVTDENGVILRINSAFTDITGYSAEDVVGKNPRHRSSGRHDAAFYAAMWDRLRSTGAWKGEIWNRRKNGEIYPESVTITAVKGDDDTVTHYVATMHDISERKRAEEKIHNLAFYDPLTRLPNRRLLQDRLQQALAMSARSTNHGALMFLDLDRFKLLNDTLGHNYGDLLLQQVAQRLQGCVRQTDTVARLGGDEFVVLLEELSHAAPEAGEQAKAVGQKILVTLDQPYDLQGQPYRSTPSIGITLFSGQDVSIDDLLKQADLAMYQAKAAGRNTLRFFEPAMLEISAEA